MSKTLKNIASWFSGTHEQLLALLSNSAGSTDTETYRADQLENFKVAELKAIAKERDLKGYSALNKTALIQFIKENS